MKVGRGHENDKDLFNLPTQVEDEHLELVLRLAIDHIFVFYLSPVDLAERAGSFEGERNRIFYVFDLDSKIFLLSLFSALLLLLLLSRCFLLVLDNFIKVDWVGLNFFSCTYSHASLLHNLLAIGQGRRLIGWRLER